jgi:hypothetical protein
MGRLSQRSNFPNCRQANSYEARRASGATTYVVHRMRQSDAALAEI